jgi:hypothetical protein
VQTPPLGPEQATMQDRHEQTNGTSWQPLLVLSGLPQRRPSPRVWSPPGSGCPGAPFGQQGFTAPPSNSVLWHNSLVLNRDNQIQIDGDYDRTIQTPSTPALSTDLEYWLWPTFRDELTRA